MAIINNIFIDQGTDFTMTVDVQNALGNALDLTGYTIAAQIRKTYGSSNVTAVFTTSHNGAGGQVTMSLPDATTTSIDSGRYVYDLMITSGAGEKTRVIEGQATVTPGVTR
mgnify:CR=1 FL=1|tara:strand:- start:753 stop:1085 length:333 start_codon:yes stop_codon:yes gene_type:complete